MSRAAYGGGARAVGFGWALLGNLTEGLLRGGFDEGDIRRILGGKCLRLFREAWR